MQPTGCIFLSVRNSNDQPAQAADPAAWLPTALAYESKPASAAGKSNTRSYEMRRRSRELAYHLAHSKYNRDGSCKSPVLRLDTRSANFTRNQALWTYGTILTYGIIALTSKTHTEISNFSPFRKLLADARQQVRKVKSSLLARSGPVDPAGVSCFLSELIVRGPGAPVSA
jgi:hypothetical protein